MTTALADTADAGLGERLYAELRQAILDCRLPPGAEVYENELARSYAVSKSPVRDALQRLRVDGLVEVMARRGYRIKPVSLADIADLYELRLAYERQSIAGLIARADDATLAGLERYRAYEHGGDLAAWIAENRAFHTTLARLSGNARLYEATRKLLEEADRVMHLGLSARARPAPAPRFGQGHDEIIAAIQRRDRRRALALIGGHVEASRDRALAALRALPVVTH
jgi:DNA-binding GntR family transcriptional regulator